MSWFYLTSDRQSTPPESLPAIRQKIELKRHTVWVANNSRTCLVHTDAEGEKGFVICGLPLVDDGTSVRPAIADDLKTASKSPDTDRLAGHFAGVSWDGGTVTFFTDKLGLRDLFILHEGERLCVSTHMQHVSASRSANVLDSQAFGGKWNLYIPCSYESVIKGIHRLGPNARAEFTFAKGLSIKSGQWDPLSGQAADVESRLRAALQRYTTLELSRTENRQSISLSGGLDSRLLLSMLINSSASWDAFSFGRASDPDILLARELAEGEGFHHTLYQPPTATTKLARDFVVSNDLFKPVSHATTNACYSSIPDDGRIVIDGAGGEILRRKVLASVALFHPLAAYKKDHRVIARGFASIKGDFWNRELSQSLRIGAENQLESAVNASPDPRAIGLGNWLDLFFIRYIFANYGSDQRRVDSILPTYSPFLQPEVVKLAMQLSVHKRTGSRFVKSEVRRQAPQLARYDLVSGSGTFPFWMPWSLQKLTKRLYTNHLITDERAITLETLRDAILDAIHSQEVIECALYDHPKILSTVTAYYAGEQQHAAFVDWWFSFELWRKANRVTSYS